ncbi:hypothetical protein A6A04_11265 [Paramagnetospirillum marisnigri]|uniref:SPOR domain-containing protein n=1 Tax=Paramagnetospirillum marisnigri TaxID=1285242 RepID=A0A178MXH8_9PROT|nr:hypothetical protein [Paramagnetospirillum marisnigri]OAN55233.1 hypothetical protein A6A04_11265 [Paramagnetospirillum marisnigri]
MRLILLLLILLASPVPMASAQVGPSDPPRIITERNGAITNHRVEGSLAPSREIGCIAVAEADNAMTPPDLYIGVRKCLDQDRFERAVELFALAGLYGNFDAMRVTDRSAGQAKTVLIMGTFSTVGPERKDRFRQALERMNANPDSLTALCRSVDRVGHPGYYPAYMILHGMKAFTGNPHDGALAPDFDAAATWTSLRSNYLHCPG